MKKISYSLVKSLSVFVLCCLLLVSLVGCGNEKEIVVGASPSPHAEILNSKEVQDFVTSKGYKLVVKVYQDYATLNKALNDGGIFANYFQHAGYLKVDSENNGFDLSIACQVHNEPLNLYGKETITDFTGKTIYIINDASNVERAYSLLLANNIITSYSVENFDAQHPVYTTDINVTIQCIDAGLLNKKVDEGEYAVIPGNYALNAWGTAKASEYRVLGETAEVAYPNIIACRTSDLNDEKISILVEALGQDSVKKLIEKTYGPTVNYVFKDLR